MGKKDFLRQGRTLNPLRIRVLRLSALALTTELTTLYFRETMRDRIRARYPARDIIILSVIPSSKVIRRGDISSWDRGSEAFVIFCALRRYTLLSV
jgi:hypothetical protein